MSDKIKSQSWSPSLAKLRIDFASSIEKLYQQQSLPDKAAANV